MFKCILEADGQVSAFHVDAKDAPAAAKKAARAWYTDGVTVELGRINGKDLYGKYTCYYLYHGARCASVRIYPI